jgi:DNA topoisomerase-3
VQTLLQHFTHTPYAEHAHKALEKTITPHAFPRMFNDSLVTDHHAIIPTATPSHTRRLSKQEHAVYDAIVRRFLAGFYPAAVFALTRFTTLIQNHVFIARGKSCLEKGWHVVEKPFLQEMKTHLLPSLESPSDVTCQKTHILACSTQAPPHHTDASILKDMEEAGLGTPATRASILETLLQRKYAQRLEKKLQATQEGVLLVQQLNVQTLKSPALTATWETQLKEVSLGRVSRTHFMQHIRGFTRTVVHSIQHTEQCPLCNQGIVIKGNQAYGCSRWREGCGFNRVFRHQKQGTDH